MARAGIEKNGKFRKLGQRLNVHASGMGEALALGLLETLWNAAYERASEQVGYADDIEADAGWRGEAGALAKHLFELRLLDKSERGGYEIHDFWEHAPPWVKRKAAAAAARAEQGRTISDIRREAGKKGHAALMNSATDTKQATDAGQTADRMPDQLTAKTAYRDGRGKGQGQSFANTANSRQPILDALVEHAKALAPPLDLVDVFLAIGESVARAAGGDSVALAVEAVAAYQRFRAALTMPPGWNAAAVQRHSTEIQRHMRGLAATKPAALDKAEENKRIARELSAAHARRIGIEE